MLRGLLVFLLALAGWGGALWFWVRPDFGQWTLPVVGAIHAVPPLVVWLGWGLWRLWRRRAERRQAAATAEQEAAAEGERQAVLADAREKHAAELRQQRTGCDCRGMAMTQIAQAPDAQPAFGLAKEGVDFSPGDAEDGVEDDISIVDHLRPGIAEALSSLYRRCPGATVLPIYVLPPAEAVGEEVFACLRAARADIAQDFGLPERRAADFNRILFLPGADCIANSVIGLFDSAPDLPGAVVLAFDSAQLRALQQDEEEGAESTPQLAERRKWLGPPSQGVFALLFTHPELDVMLDAAQRVEGDHDAMTPYWERGLPGNGHQILLAALTPEEREGLRQAPVLARVHRAAFAQFAAERRHTMAMVRNVQTLLERAQVNAALVASPFAEAAPAAEEAQGSPPPECGWLVHNAGSVDRSGNRVATLGVALFNRGLAVDPIDTGTNLVVHGGDYGQARGVALLALTIARAAQEQAAALCAEFSGDDGLGLFFAVPPGEPA